MGLLLSPKQYIPVVALTTALTVLTFLGIAWLFNFHVTIGWKSIFIAIFVFISIVFLINWVGTLILDNVACSECPKSKTCNSSKS